MMLAIAFFLFDCLPPREVRAFRAAVERFNLCPQFGIYDASMWTAYAGASPLERAYIDTRWPFYVSMAKAAVLAQIQAGVRA